MAKVILLPPYAGDFFGGRGEVEVAAGSLFALVRALDALSPGFAEAAEGAALAVNGVIAGDWTTPLSEADEVMIVPKVAGG